MLVAQAEAERPFSTYASHFRLISSDRVSIKAEVSDADTSKDARHLLILARRPLHPRRTRSGTPKTRTRRTPNPDTPGLLECRRTFDGSTCHQRGDHFCEPRADHAVAFLPRNRRLRQRPWACRPLILSPWQRDDIVRALLGADEAPSRALGGTQTRGLTLVPKVRSRGDTPESASEFS
ncbi:hypothetical protein [Amycolatopsis sp. NBC_01480]|uniref:hypothetical protein n=1 Tax=Amycolatopsis sp. NBC_01480 TaxID=2903562 RepID=UPI002E2E7480|nr:hypothetical protein [Amycolatopsis sp. NBC_01480]